ncbi:MAG TPA: tRNA epoxyqueuosine(34) reductase QueG [Terriglobia bacterium]|nr:tRNA epoxyqueuosine(34) reductase QueG [Terriglobia bacterium]
MTARRDEIKAEALKLGFDAVGFAPATLAETARQDLAQFIEEGRHGEMQWLEDKAERRGDPKVLWPEACSVIVLGLNYAPANDPFDFKERPETGNISVYARHRDYHDTVKKKLKALGRWMAERYDCGIKVFVDTAPVMEKPLAQQARLGWQGKHTNLVSRDFGSWLFLGEVYTTLDLGADEPEADHCGSCHRCLDICPTQAFTGPYRIDARRCISYLTIEHKGPIPRDLRPLMGNRIYGCDDCLAICPWNKYAQVSAQSDFQPRGALTAPRLRELAALDDETFRALFTASPIKRIGRDRFLRNVLTAIGNSGHRDLADCAINLLEDPSPLVRGAAIWALSRLVERPGIEQEAARFRAAERDESVRAEWGAVLGPDQERGFSLSGS